MTNRVLDIGTGTPILLLHGMGGVKPLNLIQAGLENDYRIIKPMMPGFLEEDGRITYSDALYVSFIEDLRLKLKIEKWVVLGYSMGGRTAMNYAFSHPEHVDKLILLDTVGIDYMIPLLKFSWGKSCLKQILPPCLKYSLVQSLLGKADFKAPSSKAYEMGKAWVQEMMYSEDIRANFVEILTTIGQPIPYLEEKAAALTVDTLILWATEDATASLQSGLRLAQMIKHANIHLLEGYKHMAPIEFPDFYIQHIKDFLSMPLEKV